MYWSIYCNFKQDDSCGYNILNTGLYVNPSNYSIIMRNRHLFSWDLEKKKVHHEEETALKNNDTSWPFIKSVWKINKMQIVMLGNTNNQMQACYQSSVPSPPLWESEAPAQRGWHSRLRRERLMSLSGWRFSFPTGAAYLACRTSYPGPLSGSPHAGLLLKFQRHTPNPPGGGEGASYYQLIFAFSPPPTPSCRDSHHMLLCQLLLLIYPLSLLWKQTNNLSELLI